MAGPVKKYFGNLSLDGIKKAVTTVPGKVSEYNGDKQLKVTAAMWDDGGISIALWDGETKTEIKLGNLRVSTFDEAPKASQAEFKAQDDDLPF